MRNITFSQDFFSFLEERKQNHSINIHWNHRWYMRRKNSIHWPQWADTTQVNPDRTEPPAGDTFGHWEREELHMTSRSTLKCSDAESHRSTASVGYLLSLSSESPRGLRMEMAGEDEGYWNRGVKRYSLLHQELNFHMFLSPTTPTMNVSANKYCVWIPLT